MEIHSIYAEYPADCVKPGPRLVASAPRDGAGNARLNFGHHMPYPILARSPEPNPPPAGQEMRAALQSMRAMQRSI
jgi:hypothetical protein